MQPPFDRPIWRPYTQEGCARPPLLVDRAEGAHIFLKSGQKIFDGISSWWLITHGHCHPKIVSAVQKQASKLDQVTFANFSHDSAEELSALLIEMTPPELTRIFFTDNGSTAVEAALKMTLQACEQNGFPEKNKFLAFSSAYHGDTVGAMSVSSRGVFTNPYHKVLFDVIRASHPTTSSASADDFVQDFESLLQHHHKVLAGVIVEPLIQGAGGMIVWPDEALRRIAKLCKEYDVYLIFDEVMTGFGRTGHLFAMNRLGVTPDLVCLSKGLTGGTLPLAVTLVREEIYESFLSEEKTRMFFHGHSFTGNPISCAAAVANLHLFKESDFMKRLSIIEETQRQCLRSLRSEVPTLDVRICGTMAAIELDVESKAYSSHFSNRLMERALDRGVFIRPLGNVIYMLPAYCSTPSELENAWDIIFGILKERV